MIRNLLNNPEIREKTAIIQNKERISYGSLAGKARAVQAVLHQYLGPALQDRSRTPGHCAEPGPFAVSDPSPAPVAAIYLPNGGAYIAALFGTFQSGAIAFPLNIQTTRYEMVPLLKQTNVKALITSKDYAPLFEEIKTEKLPDLTPIYMEELEELEALPPEILSPSSGKTNPKYTEPLILITTSGSTGKSKIVVLSEKNVEISALGYMEKMNLEQDIVKEITLLLATPFSSAYGLMCLCACAKKGISIVLLEQNFRLDTFYKAVQDHKVTHYEGGGAIPLMMEQFLGKTLPYDLGSLRYVAFGGSKVPGSTIRALLQAYPEIGFYQGYGMTEASPMITKFKIEHPRVVVPDACGTAIKDVKVFIDTENGLTDAPEVQGEIVVKGDNVMLGYYQNEEETKKVLKNGCLYTGDIGFMDKEGYLYLCGRKKNLIIVRGLNVHPEEVEACLLGCPLVKDCIVYGEEDPDFPSNELVCADIVPEKPDISLEEIRSYCRLRLSVYKQPEKLQLVPSIKKTASGKNERRYSKNHP